MLTVIEPIPQKIGLMLFVGQIFYFVDWGLGGLREGVARGSKDFPSLKPELNQYKMITHRFTMI